MAPQRQTARSCSVANRGAVVNVLTLIALASMPALGIYSASKGGGMVDHAVAAAMLDGIERGIEDIFPDAMSEAVYAQWRDDHKAVERQLALR